MIWLSILILCLAVLFFELVVYGLRIVFWCVLLEVFLWFWATVWQQATIPLG